MYQANFSLKASILIFLVMVSVQDIFGCECVAPARGNRAISHEFANAEMVITGTVISEPEMRVPFDQQSLKVRVEKIYKGKAKAGDRLTFGQGQKTDCYWYFNKEYVGKSYLFYLAKPTKARPYKTNEEIERSNAEARYYVSTCGRSAEIEEATDDVAYLERLSTVSILLPELAVLQLQPLILCKERRDLGIKLLFGG